MKLLLFCIMLVAVISGCASKSQARLEAQKVIVEEHRRALAEELQKQPSVWFRGDVRNQRVLWTEGLTLAQALVAAEYTWNWDPRVITVTRAGEVYSVNPRRLLRGEENPLLEPNDIVEVRH